MRFNYNPYTFVVVATFLNNIALGIFLLSFGLILFKGTGSTGSFSSFLIIEQIGLLLLGFYAGTLVRQYKAAYVACTANIGFGVTCLVVAVILSSNLLLEERGYFLPLLTGLCFTLSRAFFRPALFTIPSETVSSNQLHQLNSYQSIAIQSGQLIGAFVAGLVIESSNSTLALYIAGAFYLFAAIFYFISPAPFATESPEVQKGWALIKRMPEEWGAAFKLVWQHPSARFTLISVSADFFTISAFTLLLAPFVDTHFEGSGLWLGWLEMSFALGAIFGAMLSSKLAIAISRQRNTGLLIQVLAWLVLGFVYSGPEVISVALVLGMGMGLSSTSVITLLQASFDKEHHAQISVFRSMSISILLTASLPIYGYMIDISLLNASLMAALLISLLLVISILGIKTKKEYMV